jgi:hypothetical protein
MSKEAMKQMVAALESASKYIGPSVEQGFINLAIKAGRQAIAEAEKHEPVARMYEFWDDHYDAATGGQWRKNVTLLPLDLKGCRNIQPLYTTQQQRKPLSEAAIEGLAKFVAIDDFNYDFARAIEKAHGIKE